MQMCDGKRSAVALACLTSLLVALPRPARAVIVGGGSLAYLVGQADTVVKARVLTINQTPEFEHLSFVVEPISVLKGALTAVPRRILLQPAEPVWPRRLGHPYQEGVVVLLFLEKQGGRLVVQNNVNAILPAADPSGAATNAPGRNLAQKLYTELASLLRAAGSDTTRARLLVLISQVASRGQEGFFASYLRSEKPWERRAALAALLRLSPTPERVERASREFKAFLSAPRKPADEWEFWGLYEEVLYQRFEYKGDNRAAAAAALLPLYRTIADALALHPQDRENQTPDQTALRGLARANRREDALRLYRYAGSRKAYFRHEALGALCRMFGIPLERPIVTSYMMPLDPSVGERERQMQKAVRDALEREGLLP